MPRTIDHVDCSGPGRTGSSPAARGSSAKSSSSTSTSTPSSARRPRPRRGIGGRRHDAGRGSAADSLAGVCPNPIIVQTDWNPESDDFMAPTSWRSPDGTVNTNSKSYTAELIAHGGVDTGVKIEIRSGGPATGNQLNSAILYEDQNILLGFVETDEAIENSQSQPTVAIVSGPARGADDPHVEPDAHPTVKTIADLGAQNVTRFSTSREHRSSITWSAPAFFTPARSTGPTTAPRPSSWRPGARSPSRGSPPQSPTSTSTRSASG